MILVGRYLSPFVRRVGTTMNLYGIEYENRPLTHTGDDIPDLRALNPVGRVPALVIEDNEIIVDSDAILDHLDRRVGLDRSFMPASGKERDRALSMIAIASGAVEKAIATLYEVRFRPEDKRHAPWVERCTEQARGGFGWLESQFTDEWLLGDSMTQVDITAAVYWQFIGRASPDLQASIDAPKIAEMSAMLGATPEFKATLPDS